MNVGDSAIYDGPTRSHQGKTFICDRVILANTGKYFLLRDINKTHYKSHPIWEKSLFYSRLKLISNSEKHHHPLTSIFK